MRTTLTLDADAFQAAKAKAAHEGIPLGKAVSELILQALRQPVTRKLPGAVFRSEGGTYGADEVEADKDCLNEFLGAAKRQQFSFWRSLRRADILVCRWGRLSSRRGAGKPRQPAGWKTFPTPK